MIKQLNTEFPKKKAISSQLVQFNAKLRKKQDPLKIVLTCKVSYYKEMQKNPFFQKLAEIWLKDVRTRNIEI